MNTPILFLSRLGIILHHYTQRHAVIRHFFTFLMLFVVWGYTKNQSPIHYTLSYINTPNSTKQYQLSLTNTSLSIKNVTQKNVLLVLLSSKCTTCTAQIQILKALKPQYTKELFIAYLFIDTIEDNPSLKSFLHKYAISYFNATKSSKHFAHTLIKGLSISDDLSMPISILYQNNHYLQHYEGLIPQEILQHEIP